jgi:hypothetical protein
MVALTIIMTVMFDVHHRPDARYQAASAIIRVVDRRGKRTPVAG